MREVGGGPDGGADRSVREGGGLRIAAGLQLDRGWAHERRIG